ncbi:MAG: bile acid:sodium symporter family protein [Phycisphaeraceae bacterium]
MQFLRSQWFSVAMVGLFVLAWLWPQLAAAIGLGGFTKHAAIMLIFLVSGLSLRLEESIRALGAWRLHMGIQGLNLVLIPLACWLLVRPVADTLPEGLVVGLYLPAAVPTTITSCVIFTQFAGGNTAAALLNAVAGNMAGVFISPLLLILMLGASDVQISLDPWQVFAQLGLIVLLPFALGQLLHNRLPTRNPKFRKIAGQINRSCILLIIYLAFGELFLRDIGEVAWARVLVPLVLLLPAHLLLVLASDAVAKLLRLGRADRVAMLFCAPQKTLSLGVPMATAVLASRPELLGLALLPILVYHPIQLLFGGILEERLRRFRISDF